MIDQNLFKDISKKLDEIIPDDVKSACGDLEKNVKTVVKSALGKVDMVPREEFDAQTNVLARTREKLEALEKQIAELEAKLVEKQKRGK